MNEFDQFIKHELHIKHYARYTDDFAIGSSDRVYLENLIEPISKFLRDRLALALHPKKISIRELHQGIDFLGYVIFPKHRLLRTKTKHRIFKKLEKRMKEYKTGNTNRLNFEQSLQSYLGVLSHANTYAVREELLNRFWFSCY